MRSRIGRTRLRNSTSKRVRLVAGIPGGGTAPLAINGLIFEGDSITRGAKAVTAQEVIDDYPSQFANLTGMNIMNVGTNGISATAIDTGYATRCAPFFNAST